jgi:hypothetical protein
MDRGRGIFSLGFILYNQHWEATRVAAPTRPAVIVLLLTRELIAEAADDLPPPRPVSAPVPALPGMVSPPVPGFVGEVAGVSVAG